MTDAAARLTTLTRLGFAARGLLYFVIAILIVTTGRAKDPAGALRYLGESGGQILLVLVTLGLFAYGLWRLSDAAFNIERHGKNDSEAAERLGAAGSGAVHLFLAWQAVKLLRGVAAPVDDSTQARAQSVLDLPAGGMLLIAGGMLLLIVGAFQLIKSLKGTYLQYLEPRIARQPWAKWSGRFGYAARSVIFLITGVFFVRAGIEEEASEAGGMADALSWLNSPWDFIVAAGLFGFGLFSLIEARYRVLHDVPVEGIGRRVSAKFE